ncbi:hypothetical protein ACJMK2_019709 [Sinanodonta woodiana]|uniref:Myb/SANT-like DNA-binding domain-containing protein n=1 Tax=Sinanodonta woodiana TaxID=1069815 RepID=A0ABD3TX06_SINWO
MENKYSIRGVSWTYGETDVLLDVWKADDIQRELVNTHRNCEIYDRVAARLNELLSTERTAVQCRSRIKRLKLDYYAQKRSGDKGPRNKLNKKFFEIFDKALKNNFERRALMRDCAGEHRDSTSSKESLDRQMLPLPLKEGVHHMSNGIVKEDIRVKAETKSECFVTDAAKFTPDSVQENGKSLENIQFGSVSCNSCDNESVEQVVSPDLDMFETHERRSSHRYSPYQSVFGTKPFPVQDPPLNPAPSSLDKLITHFTSMEERRLKYEIDLQQKRLEREERMMRHLMAMEDKARTDENKLRLEMAEIFDKRRREINDIHVQMFQMLCSVIGSSPSVHHSSSADISSNSVRPLSGQHSGSSNVDSSSLRHSATSETLSRVRVTQASSTTPTFVPAASFALSTDRSCNI